MERVGTSTIPCLAIRSRSFGARCRLRPCSIVSTPASIARRAPSSPSAWAATRTPIRWASSTTAAISSAVTCARSGSSRVTDRAPVAMILMKSAPRRSCARTALRISHGPSASSYIVPKIRPPGEVAEMIRAQDRIRGPSTRPSRTASRRVIASSSGAPTSRTVVIPDLRKARAALARTNQRSASARGSSPWSAADGPNPGLRSVSLRTWAWASMSPGRTLLPARSSASGGMVAPSVDSTAAMTPACMRRTARSTGGPPVPSIRRQSHRTRSGIGSGPVSTWRS